MPRGSPRIWKQKTRLEPVPFNAKIADINEADTNKHILDLETALGETRKITYLILEAKRISGTGEFKAWPNEGTTSSEVLGDYRARPVMIKEGSQRLQYSQTISGDDWDLYCYGYEIEA